MEHTSLSLYSRKEYMSNLTEIRTKHGSKAVVDAVRVDYPGFNKRLLSQCENPNKYGVRLVPEADKLVEALEAPKNRTERRKKANRYYFRLNDHGAKVLTELCKVMDCSSVQSLCELLIHKEAFKRGIRI